jgi:8-oxo-dGTP diphosphatase
MKSILKLNQENLMHEEKTLLEATLGFLVDDEQRVLLARKTKKIGAGCWNGYGGGLEGNETPAECMVRELVEETKVITSPEFIEKMAEVDFYNTKSAGTLFVCKVHVYLIHQWQGEPQATDTMANPTWFLKSRLPLDEMMPADRHWVPLVLNGTKLVGQAHYGPYQKELLKGVKVTVQKADAFI